MAEAATFAPVPLPLRDGSGSGSGAGACSGSGSTSSRSKGSSPSSSVGLSTVNWGATASGTKGGGFMSRISSWVARSSRSSYIARPIRRRSTAASSGNPAAATRATTASVTRIRVSSFRSVRWSPASSCSITPGSSGTPLANSRARCSQVCRRSTSPWFRA